MRKREKLTPEERFALALELVKRDRSLEEICLHYQVSHTTAYKIRNAFLDGGRRALAGARGRTAGGNGNAKEDWGNAVG
jgi:transposase-like protein